MSLFMEYTKEKLSLVAVAMCIMLLLELYNLKYYVSFIFPSKCLEDMRFFLELCIRKPETNLASKITIFYGKTK